MMDNSQCITSHTAVSPGPVTLTPTPSSLANWEEGDTLTLTCAASVGTVDNDTEVRVVLWRVVVSWLLNVPATC